MLHGVRQGPPGTAPRGQLGPRALALIGVLGTHYHLTHGKVRDLLAQVLSLPSSTVCSPKSDSIAFENNDLATEFEISCGGTFLM